MWDDEYLYCSSVKLEKSLYDSLSKPAKKVLPKKPLQRAEIKPRPTNTEFLGTLMKAKELDTKINMMRKQGKKPEEFVDLLDEFQKNSTEITIKSTNNNDRKNNAKKPYRENPRYKNTYDTADKNVQLHGVLSEIECAIHNFDDEMKSLQNRIFDCVGV